MSNYEAMSIPELEAAIGDLTEQQRVFKTQKLAAHAVLDVKLKEAEAKRKLKRMSDGEKQTLLQELQAEGVGSVEEFGEM